MRSEGLRREPVPSGASASFGGGQPSSALAEVEAPADIYNKEMLRKWRVGARVSKGSWPENARKSFVPGGGRVTWLG